MENLAALLLLLVPFLATLTVAAWFADHIVQPLVERIARRRATSTQHPTL